MFANVGGVTAFVFAVFAAVSERGPMVALPVSLGVLLGAERASLGMFLVPMVGEQNLGVGFERTIFAAEGSQTVMPIHVVFQQSAIGFHYAAQLAQIWLLELQ